MAVARSLPGITSVMAVTLTLRRILDQVGLPSTEEKPPPEVRDAVHIPRGRPHRERPGSRAEGPAARTARALMPPGRSGTDSL